MGCVSASRSRFIPARAGNTLSCRATSPCAPVHPRAGGEHSPVWCGANLASGSSPRGRGTHYAADDPRLRRRFIPARAGNTRPCRSKSFPPTVHPRAGGEHRGSFASAGRAVGSSPRGRGTPENAHPRRRVDRFIPARAGNTLGMARTHHAKPVHPRAGGEHPSPNHCRSGVRGSSPRGRGTPGDHDDFPGPGRFIPARAGNTQLRSGARTSAAVHPRAGGEHPDKSRPRVRAIGSSPRGRGTPIHMAAAPGTQRFIPARAGNTSSQSSAP